MDLIEHPLNYKAASREDYPIVPTSAEYHTNLTKLIETIEEKLNSLFQKKRYNLINPL